MREIAILSGHVSPETAYIVTDYPYGFRLRCQMRYWLDVSPKHGVRMMSQTSNPKRPGLVWNTPKGSTYCRFGMALYLDDAGHVQQTGMHEYMEHAACIEWLAKYRSGVPELFVKVSDAWIKAITGYAARKAAA